MIYNITKSTFGTMGTRCGDLIAICNIVEYLRKTKDNPNIQFYIPKKSKKVESSKYFRWKEYNEIYKLEEEINADVESLAICPRMKLAMTAAQINEERQRRLHRTTDPTSDHCSEHCHNKRKGEEDPEL